MSTIDDPAVPVVDAAPARAGLWLDSIAFLKRPNNFVVDSDAFGSTFWGWHEYHPTDGERWLRRAAQDGDLYAKEKLGLRLINGDGLEEASVEGITLLKEAAESGSPTAMERLATCLFNLTPTPEAWQEAERWLRKAIAHNYPVANIALAVRFLTGKGMTLDIEQGKAMLHELAQHGNRLANLKLGVYLLAGGDVNRDREEGLSWLRRIGAAQAEQISSLGLYLYMKSLSLPRHERREWAEEASVLFQEAIRQGSRADELNLVYLIRRGDISTTSHSSLDELLQLHLQENNPGALVNEALRRARGVECAVDWQAADGLIGRIEEPEPILSWWFRRSEEGDAEGHLVTAWLCRHQLAVDPDQLALAARMDLARRGGWAVPTWMNFPRAHKVTIR